MAKRDRVQDDAKRERRLERQRAEAEAKRRHARRRQLRRAAGAAIGGIVVVAVGWFVVRPDPEVAGVVRPEGRGGGHVAEARFDSPTPTSGPHSASVPPCGTMSQELPPELAVHALEHGAVVVWHRPDLPVAERIAVRDVLSEWDSHWILAPNDGIDEPVVATAWNRLKAFDAEADGLREFTDTYRRRGPERVDCPA